MENSILNSFPVDPGIFLIVLLILNMILIIVTIRSIINGFTADMMSSCGEKMLKRWKIRL